MKARNKAKLKSIYGAEPFKYDKVMQVWKNIPDIILFAIFLLYITISLLFLTNYSYYVVQHTSMQPLLNNYTQEELNAGVCDGVYINSQTSYQIGDVIVIKNDLDIGVDTVVKRLIAVGGDKIAIEPITLSNGTMKYEVLRIPKGNSVPYTLVENYVSEENQIYGMPKVYENFQNYLDRTVNKEEINGVTYLVLKDDEIFYMGDNRGNSRDCSEYGPIKVSQIIGKVDIIVYKQENMLFYIFQYLLGFKTI